MFEAKDYVLEIYKTGSFSQAAANLYVSQPALSMVIKRLEKQICEPLFDRSAHPIRLTDCGKQYVASALSIIESEKDFLSYLDDYRNLTKGSIIIGGSNMNISYILPPIIKLFIAKYPAIELKLVEGNIDVLLRKLADGELDLLIDSCEVDAKVFQHYLYVRENLLLVVPDNLKFKRDVSKYALDHDDIMNNRHLSPDKKPFPINYLGSLPFVSMNPETDTYVKSRQLFKHYSYQPNIIASFSQSATALNVAYSGIGATFASDELIKAMPINAKASFYKVLPEYGTRYIKFYAKRAHRITYAMRALIAIAQDGKQYNDYELLDPDMIMPPLE